MDSQGFQTLCKSPYALQYTELQLTEIFVCRGKILGQLGEDQGILYVDIDLEVLKMARAGIPVTRQRRFDVYSDVSAE